MSTKTPMLTLKVDWLACTGRRLCAELLPEAIAVDEWGYPVIDGAISPHDETLAREAAAACPRRALRLLRS
ncbi:MAG: ferredoxin [Nostocoides sp.]